MATAGSPKDEYDILNSIDKKHRSVILYAFSEMTVWGEPALAMFVHDRNAVCYLESIDVVIYAGDIHGNNVFVLTPLGVRLRKLVRATMDL